MTRQPDLPLYGRDAAAALRRREACRLEADGEKFRLLLDAMRRREFRRLVDIGCGWGQLLAEVAAALPDVELWGVDESPDRAREVAASCPAAKVVLCRADALDLPDAHFDMAVTSQVLHEVRLFGRGGELVAVVGEIRRILAPGGQWLLLDHLDAGEGEVTVFLPAPAKDQLAEFERTFRYAPAAHESLQDGTVRIPRRCLQDFLTKAWSLGTAMEPIEMAETHNVFRRKDTERLLAENGFAVECWQELADIRADLARVGGRLLHGEPWRRKFLAVAARA